MRSVFNAIAGPRSALTLVPFFVVQLREYVEDERKVWTEETGKQTVRVFVREKKERFERFPLLLDYSFAW